MPTLKGWLSHARFLVYSHGTLWWRVGGDLSELELCSSVDIQFQVVAESEWDVDYDDNDDEEMSELHSGLDEDEGDF